MGGRQGDEEIDVEGAVEFSKYIEEAMCGIVHHSTWSLETLIALILDKVTQSFLVGERVTMRGKKGTFKVMDQDATGGYTLQPASGGPPLTGIGHEDMIRPQGSQVHLLTPDSIAAWLDFSADVRDLDGNHDEGECLWRMKKMYRDAYNLDSAIPEAFAGKVKFPLEHNDGNEQDTYEPSEDDDEEEEDDDDEGRDEDDEEEELEIEEPLPEGHIRKKRLGHVSSHGEGDVDLDVMETLVFDGAPLRKTVFGFLFETMADVEERFSSNEDKLAVFKVLKHAGQEGRTVDDILAIMAANDCALPEQTSEAREYIVGVCNSDAAFFKRTLTKYCLTATIAKSIVDNFVSVFEKCADETLPQPDRGRRASPESKIEARQIDTLKRLGEQYLKNVQKYQLKCPKCHRFVSSAKVKVPIRKCKTCPRAYHVDCLDESEITREADVWSCEKCIDIAQLGLRKILDLEEKKEQMEEKSRHEAAEKKKKVAHKSSRTNTKSKETRKAPRKYLSDLEVLEEGKKSISALKKQIEQGAAAADLAKAKQELARIQHEIEGPPKKYEMVLTSPDAFAAFNEASGISEFLSLYGDICELEEILDTPDLLLSTSWPLDQSSSLVSLFSQLLLCCLLEQLNRDPPMKSRARKWTRVLTNATWPEVLRKYIKCTRVPSEKEVEEGIYEPIGNLQGPSRGLYSDDFEMLKNKADDFLTKKGWWEMPAGLQLSLLHALCYDISQGYTLKLDMNNKIQDCAKISTEFGKITQQARRIRKEKQQGDKKKTVVNNDNGSDEDDDNDDDDDLGEEIALQVSEKQEETEETLASRSFRTESLGSDRYGRRYWWLRGSQGIILIEDHQGRHAGVIKSQEELDNVMKRLIRRGPHEGSLLRTMRRFYKRLCASLLGEGLESSIIIDKIQRPMPTDGRQKVRTLGDLSTQMMSNTLSEAKMKVDEILSEIATADIQLAKDLKGYRKILRAFETPSEVCTFMLELEAILCTAGEGLPPYGSNDMMDTFLGSEYSQKLPPVVYMEASGEKEDKPEPVKEEEKAQDGDAASDGEVDHITALIQENPLFKALKPFIAQPSPVTCDDDYDCSEAEHTYLREKRMRKPARLWRSGRERAVWLKGVLQAAEAPAAVGCTQATLNAYILGDRVNLLIERCQALEKEIARWEAEEQERQQAEILLEREKSSQIKEPRERPMMIRTGKAKTDSGVKVVLKLIGREPFPQGRNATTAMDIMASEEDAAKCRWGYQCSVCLLAGDLLCCEHKDGCAVSVHQDCSGHGFPEGKWICPNHDESNLKTRVRKRSEQSIHPEGGPENGRRSFVEPDPLADMMSSDDELNTLPADSRKRRMSDSATITDESTQDDDDSDYM